MNSLPSKFIESDSVGTPLYGFANSELNIKEFVYANAKEILAREVKNSRNKSAVVVARKCKPDTIETAIFDIQTTQLVGVAIFAQEMKMSDQEIIDNLATMISSFPNLLLARETTMFLFENE